MPSYFAGIRSTADFGADERPKEFREAILFLNPNGTAPLFALTSKARAGKKLSDPEFSWWYQRLDVPRVRVTTATGALLTDNTITCSAGGCLRFRPMDTIQFVKTVQSQAYTEEIGSVSSVTNDTTMIVKRGQAGSTPQAVALNSDIMRIGSCFPEGSGAPQAAYSNPDKRTNLAQIFRTSFEQTGTDAETTKRTGDSWKNDKRKNMFLHSADIEMAMFWGRKFETVGANGKPQRCMGGLRENILDNTTIFTTTPTFQTMVNALTKPFDWDTEAGNERIAFCGNGFLNSFNFLAMQQGSTRLEQGPVLRLWGMELSKYILPQGTIAFKTHPLFNRDPVHTYSCFVLDPTAVVYRPLRETDFRDNIQSPDADTRKAEWLTECSLELTVQETSAFIGNFLV